MSWDRVGDEIERRIADLGTTRKAVAKRAGIDESSLWKVRKGRGGEVSADLRALIDQALRWPVGTIDAIYGGAEPPSEVLTDPQRLDRLEARLAAMAEQVERLSASFDQLR